MKRQTFMKSTLCLLMALVCNVAWAQTFVMPETGKYYKIKGTHSTNPWLTATVENGGIDVAADEADAAVYLRTENGLQAIATGKFIGTGGNGSQISLVDTEAEVAIEAADKDRVYIKTSGRYLYNNQPDYTREAGNLTAASADAPKWGFIEQDAAEVLTTLKASAVAHVGEHTAYLGTGIGYYSYVVGGAKTADPEAVKAAINAAATIEAVSAIVGTYAVNLPEFGKAYTMTFVANNDAKSRYNLVANGSSLSVSNTDEGSVFYCIESDYVNYPYVFISPEGKMLAYNALTDTYATTGKRINNFEVGGMVEQTSSNITGDKSVRLGTVYVMTEARNASSTSLGCFVLPSGGGSLGNSSAPFHNGAHTSAIVMTEQDINSLTDAQVAKADEILGRTALKEQVEELRGQLKNQVGYYYCTINGVKMYDADAILAAINAASSAATVAEIAAAVNAKTPVMPEYGKTYKMAFKTKAGALHHIVANDRTMALSVDADAKNASVFYCMASNDANYPYIFVSAEGGFLTFKALSDAYINKVTDFKVGLMTGVTSNVDSSVESRFGTVYIATNKRPNIDKEDDGCFVYKNQNNTYDGADVPFHNDNFTSAIVMTEVAAESKTIYDIVVDGDDDAQANAYVAYDNGTVVRKAFHNGYLVTDAALTEAQLKAAYVGNVVKSATITVEDNVITLADVVTFPAPVKQDLYNTSNGSLEVPPYRIPGITVDPETGRIITTAARLVCGTDPGYGQVDVVCRISDNHGETWSDMIDVAVGNGVTSATVNYFETAFGDPAVVADRTSNEVLIIAVAGCTVYANGNTTRQNPNMIATIHSTDNGETWGDPVNVTEPIYSLFDSGNPIQSAFVGGGKIFQSRIVKVGDYYRLYAAMCARPNGNRVIYSDDFGRTWHALGGASALPAPGGDEPKCEEMPDGRVILSSRVGGGRIYNIYTYSNTLTAEGSWGTDVKSTFEGSGKTPGGNSTNGEILIVPVQRNSDSKDMYLALQSLPTGSGRSNVGIFYKELTDMTDINSVANFATDWNGFFEVTTKASAYSSMDLQADNRIGFIYEETLTGFGKVNNPVSTNFPNGEGTHNYDGYDNIYVAYPLEIITNGAYSIKREVSRRAYVSDYFTALAAEANKDVQNKVAAALDNLSDEPTIAEVDKLNYLLTLDSFWPSYAKNVTIGEKITDFSTIEDGQAVVFKLVSGNSYITINEDCNAGMSADPTGLSVFKMHRVGDTQTFSFESARKGYYFPELQNSGWPTYTMQKTDNPIAFEFLSQKSDGGTLGEGQFVVKSTTANAYFDGKATAFTGWEGKGANCAYEVYKVSPNEEKYYIGDFNFTVIDDLGNSYTGSSRGALGETVTSLRFIGIEGYTLENGKWSDDNKSYTAHIKFPFPISNENITNATQIASFNDAAYRWHAEGTSIKVTKNVAPSNENLPSHLWAIYPEYATGAFNFTIKNIDTGKYVYSISTENSHDENAVKLSDEGSKFTVDTRNRFKLPTNKYLSLNSTSGGDGSIQILGTWDDHSGCNIKFLEPNPYYAVSAKIGNVGYATLYAPVALTVPKGLVAYTGLYNSDKTTLTLTPLAAGKTIPANTGVILAGAMGTYPFEKAEDAEAITDNVLTGTALGIATSSVTDGVVYTLQQDGEDVVFMEYTGVALAAGKAYLVLSEAAKSISIRFEGTTDIEHSTLNPQPSTQIYDLLGRRVEAITKGGIYIVNGKKVVVK